MLKSRTMWPPGGWQFLEPSTGWKAPQGLTFSQVVTEIIKHRLANKQYKLATDPDVVAQQLDDYTCARLGNAPGWCSEQTVPRSFISPLPVRSLRAEGSVAGGAKFLRNTGAGIKLWIDWFGEGTPVDKTVAETRAAICAECDQNEKKKSIMQWFTGTAAREIMAIFSALNDLDLHTSKDEKLNICKACDCPLKAKVWAPLRIIKKHLRQDSYHRLDEKCWIRHERID